MHPFDDENVERSFQRFLVIIDLSCLACKLELISRSTIVPPDSLRFPSYGAPVQALHKVFRFVPELLCFEPCSSNDTDGSIIILARPDGLSVL